MLLELLLRGWAGRRRRLAKGLIWFLKSTPAKEGTRPPATPSTLPPKSLLLERPLAKALLNPTLLHSALHAHPPAPSTKATSPTASLRASAEWLCCFGALLDQGIKRQAEALRFVAHVGLALTDQIMQR